MTDKVLVGRCRDCGLSSPSNGGPYLVCKRCAPRPIFRHQERECFVLIEPDNWCAEFVPPDRVEWYEPVTV